MTNIATDFRALQADPENPTLFERARARLERNGYQLFGFRQNNSNGYFIGDPWVVVMATSEREALRVATTHGGVYFDGVAEGRDCECCGDRWDRFAWAFEPERTLFHPDEGWTLVLPGGFKRRYGEPPEFEPSEVEAGFARIDALFEEEDGE